MRPSIEQLSTDSYFESLARRSTGSGEGSSAFIILSSSLSSCTSLLENCDIEEIIAGLSAWLTDLLFFCFLWKELVDVAPRFALNFLSSSLLICRVPALLILYFCLSPLAGSVSGLCMGYLWEIELRFIWLWFNLVP